MYGGGAGAAPFSAGSGAENAGRVLVRSLHLLLRPLPLRLGRLAHGRHLGLPIPRAPGTVEEGEGEPIVLNSNLRSALAFT